MAFTAPPPPPKKPRPPIDVWLASPARLDQVMHDLVAIEREGFADPWAAKDFRQWAKDPRYCLLAASSGYRVIGFTIFGFKEAEVEIAKVGVTTIARRAGVGLALVNGAVRHARETAPHSPVAAVVRDDDLEAQLFFRACGFKAVKVLKRVMPDYGDAWRFVRTGTDGGA